MIVAFDNTFLTLMLNPDTAVRPNPATGKPVAYCRQRIEALIDELSNGSGNRLIVPAPCLAEALVAVPDVQKVVAAVRKFSAIEIAPFDSRAAIELAIMTRVAIEGGDKNGGPNLSWQQVKFDRQIVAIAKANGASVLYTDDGPQSNFAAKGGLTVKHTWDLELPGKYAQMGFEDVEGE